MLRIFVLVIFKNLQMVTNIQIQKKFNVSFKKKKMYK